MLQNIREKLSIFNTYLTKKHKDVPLLVDKLGLFLNLYCTTCEKAKILQSKNTKQIKPRSEECDVRELWMKSYCPKEPDSISATLTPTIVDYDIEVLERLLISASRYSYVAMATMKALDSARSLKEAHFPLQENSQNQN